METKYLTYILTIAKYKNMTKAARELYVSQSSLSQYLTKLEQEMGTPLFFRTKGELIPTEAGKLYLETARRVLQMHGQLCRDIAGLENKGHITVGVTSQFGLMILSEAIPKLKETFPEISVEITESALPQLSRMLQEESLDLAIMAVNDTEPWKEHGELLGAEEVLFALPADHPFCRGRKNGASISLDDFSENFREDAFLLSKKGSSLRFLTDQLFHRLSFTPYTMCETNSTVAVQSMVAGGAGVGFVAQSWATARSDVCYFSMDPPLIRFHILACRKNWQPGRGETLFCTCIKEAYLKERQRWQR